jgi:N12 class adenine-specific DNA methylase
MPQSFFNMLPDDPAIEAGFMEDQLREFKEAYLTARTAEGSNAVRVKNLQQAIAKAEKRLNELLSRKKDVEVYWDQLGVDALLVDEAHEYKKVPFATGRDNVKGLDKGSSQRALSLLLKIREIYKRLGAVRNVALATGTPITNTLAEAWNMIRLVRPDVLKQYNVDNFDDFAGLFCRETAGWEPDAAGRYREVTRFAKFVNVQSLRAFFRSGADVRRLAGTEIAGVPKMKSHKGSQKRIGVTGSGKPIRVKSWRGHHLELKSSRRTRRWPAL